MQRTPPPGPPGQHPARHPSTSGQQGLGRNSLYPDMDEDEPDSPFRQQNITPLAPADQEPSLQSIMEAIQELKTRADDTQRQIQDLVALFARTNSPPAAREQGALFCDGKDGIPLGLNRLFI